MGVLRVYPTPKSAPFFERAGLLLILFCRVVETLKKFSKLKKMRFIAHRVFTNRDKYIPFILAAECIFSHKEENERECELYERFLQ